MKRLTWLAVCCAACAVSACAENLVNQPGPANAQSQAQSASPDLVTIQTRYGKVWYHAHGRNIMVEGGYPWTPKMDFTRHLGVFHLYDKDVILLENYQPGMRYGETFFLVLRPGKAAEFIQVPIWPYHTPIKRVWQEKEVIYVDIAAPPGYAYTSPMKFDFAKKPFGPRIYE